MAERIQRKRTKGWRLPPGAVIVSRPSLWGNPFPVSGDWIMWTAVALGYRGDAPGRRAAAVALHRSWMTREPTARGPLWRHGGSTVEYASGRVVGIGGIVEGFTAMMSDMASPLAIPERPSLDFLRGHDLACWCKTCDEHHDGLSLGTSCTACAPCHADTLLELANQPSTEGSDR